MGHTNEEHDEHLCSVLQQCQKVNIKLNLVKFQFCKTKVHYLECMLNNKGLSVDPNSAEDIFAVQVPENGKELKTFLSMVKFVATYIPKMPEIYAPLENLLKNNAWVWTNPQKESVP